MNLGSDELGNLYRLALTNFAGRMFCLVFAKRYGQSWTNPFKIGDSHCGIGIGRHFMRVLAHPTDKCLRRGRGLGFINVLERSWLCIAESIWRNNGKVVG